MRILPERMVELMTARAVEQRFPNALIWSTTNVGSERWDQSFGTAGKAWLFELKAPEEPASDQGAPGLTIDLAQLKRYLDRTDVWTRWSGWVETFQTARPPEVRNRLDRWRRVARACPRRAEVRHPNPRLACWGTHLRQAWEILEGTPRRDQYWSVAHRDPGLLPLLYVLPTPVWSYVPHGPLPGEGSRDVRDSFESTAWVVDAYDLASHVGLPPVPPGTSFSPQSWTTRTHAVSLIPGAVRLSSFLRSVGDCSSGRRFGIERRDAESQERAPGRPQDADPPSRREVLGVFVPTEDLDGP